LYDPVPSLENRDGLFWLPLLGLWTGMRLSECAQLWIHDVSIVEKIPIIRILPEPPGEDPGNDKRLKTIHSTRVMPIHPELARVGFVEYWRHAVRQGHQRLFPELRREGAGHGFARPSKLLTAFVRSATHGDRLVCFQSFRHTFRDAARDGRLPKDRARILGGWGNKDMSDRYGIGGSIPHLYKDIQQISYPGLDLSHLEI
jgi:integrase